MVQNTAGRYDFQGKHWLFDPVDICSNEALSQAARYHGSFRMGDARTESTRTSYT